MRSTPWAWAFGIWEGEKMNKGFGKITLALAQVREPREPYECGDDPDDDDQWYSLDDMRDMYKSTELHSLRKLGYTNKKGVWSK